MSFTLWNFCRRFKLLKILWLFLFIWPTHSISDLPIEIEKKIRSKGLKASYLGLVISKIQPDGKAIPLYSVNEDKLFIPASLVKIATLSALYHYYPSSYTFKTSFVSSASIQKGILKGNLVLKGGGDSSFTSESLWNVINNLTRSGIKEIQGSLLIDDSLYQQEKSFLNSSRSYHAPASASSLNWNSTAFYIRPGKTLNSPALVFADPENSYIEVINKVITRKKTRIQVQRRSSSLTKEIFEIKGQIDINTDEVVKYSNISQPPLWLGYNALAFLKQRGIQLVGPVKKGVCQRNCKTLAEWESRPLAFHSYNLMKYSSNFVARMLVSHLPLLKGEKQGDLRQGMKKLSSYLKQKEGIKNFRLEEPSGLSRKNRFTPKDLQKILISAQTKLYSPEMLFAYPLAKGKGTLNKRFTKLPSSSFVRAKTGSLYGVLGLAGWAGTNKKTDNYVFVFIFNGPAGKSPKAQDFFDEMIVSLLK